MEQQNTKQKVLTLKVEKIPKKTVKPGIRHKWSPVHVGALIGGCRHTVQKCLVCDIVRQDGYIAGKTKYYESDGVTPRLKAGPCKPKNK